MSRKRAAPGASTTIQPNLGFAQQPGTSDQSTQAFAASTNAGLPLMTDDQFLDWGQHPSEDPAMPLQEPLPTNTFGPLSNALHNQPAGTMSGMANPAGVQSTELTRRQPGQYPSNLSRQFGNPTEVFGTFDDSQNGEVEEGKEDDKNIEKLQSKALAVKREAQGKRKQLPPFIQKLWSFLDDNRNPDLIRWSERGDSFIVLDEEEFAKTMIPELYKHNNYASFVRQLNMYGFHKKVGLSDNSMRASERKNKTPSEYANPYFRREYPDLLWLINKPKSAPTGRGPKAGKTDTKGHGQTWSDAEDVGDEHGSPDAHTSSVQMITGGSEKGDARANVPKGQKQLGRDAELTEVRRQLHAIQSQQRIISSAISRLQKDHDQFYTQAHAFQSLHDRHESSINAILTFLATVYNRSLEGHGNIANIFGGSIPQDGGGQRGVVDVGDFNSSEGRRFKKSPLLLGSSPHNSQSEDRDRAETLSPSAGRLSDATKQAQKYRSSPGRVVPESSSRAEELPENSPIGSLSGSPQVKMEHDTSNAATDSDQTSQRDIMSMIHSTNAKNEGLDTSKLDFPTALTHYQNANGKSPLTPKQRNEMLNMMAQNTQAGNVGSNNALSTPNPPQIPDLSRLSNAKGELEVLTKLQAEQDAKVQELRNMIEPLSPSGSIPGLNPQYYPGAADGTGPLDLDQIFSSNDYFGSDGNGGDGVGYDFGEAGNDQGAVGANDQNEADLSGLTFEGDEPFNFEDDAGQTGRVTGTVENSEATSPAGATSPNEASPPHSSRNDQGKSTPNKRQRRQ